MGYIYFSKSPDLPTVVGNATSLLALPRLWRCHHYWQCHRLLAMTHCRYMSNHKISGDEVRSSEPSSHHSSRTLHSPRVRTTKDCVYIYYVNLTALAECIPHSVVQHLNFGASFNVQGSVLSQNDRSRYMI